MAQLAQPIAATDPVATGAPLAGARAPDISAELAQGLAAGPGPAEAPVGAQVRQSAQAPQPAQAPLSALAPAPVPSLAGYALATAHPVGRPRHPRSGQSGGCAAQTDADAAQRAFLAAGGPGRDPLGLDPDGDGYACAWDPTPLRQAADGRAANGRAAGR